MRNWPFKSLRPGAPIEELNAQLSDLSRKTSDRTATFPVDVAGVPDVAGASVWRTANSVATNYTGFANGYDTARLLILGGDVHTTLVHSAGLVLAGGVNVTLAVNQIVELLGTTDPTTRVIHWIEIP